MDLSKKYVSGKWHRECRYLISILTLMASFKTNQKSVRLHNKNNFVTFLTLKVLGGHFDLIATFLAFLVNKNCKNTIIFFTCHFEPSKCKVKKNFKINIALHFLLKILMLKEW